MISKELFKSRKFIILISMMINIMLILIGSIWFDNNSIHLELSSLLLLSLLLGPYSIVGFTIVEVLYWILFLGMTNPLTILLTGSSLFILGIMPWKLWYSIKSNRNYEIPNLNSFSSFIKIICIIFFMILQTYLFTNQIFDKVINLNLESYYMIFVLGLILLLLGMGIFGKLNIATYTPKQIKKIMPIKLYEAFFLISIILSILTINNQNTIYLLLILIFSGIFLIKPLNEDVFKIENTSGKKQFVSSGSISLNIMITRTNKKGYCFAFYFCFSGWFANSWNIKLNKRFFADPSCSKGSKWIIFPSIILPYDFEYYY